jgi:DNA polymerase
MTGAAKLKDTLKRGQGDISVDVTLDDAQDIVSIYRKKNARIVTLWGECGYFLSSMVAGRSGRIGNLLTFDRDGILMPNGMRLQYHGLTCDDRKFSYISDKRMYERAVKARLLGASADGSSKLIAGQSHLYGGKVTENVVQALARIVVSGQMLAIRDAGYHVAFQVHDENVCVVPEDQAEQAEKDIVEIMSTPPSWAPDLPVACEAGMADNYGDA